MSIIKIHTTTSTNDALKSLVRTKSLDNFTTLSADYQTTGRGEQGNVWQSDASKNLLFSTLIKHDSFSVHLGFKLNEMVSLAIVDVLRTYHKAVLIKWPNDILADSKKIAGILIENIIKGSVINYSIVGVGLNVNQVYFEGLEDKAVSLAQLTGKAQNSDVILEQIIARYRYYFERSGQSDFHEQYRHTLYGYRQTLTYKDKQNEVFIAKIVRVERSGLLVLEDEHGRERQFDKKMVELLY